jgi:mannitol-1-phosphate/altronate dehydrogenase
MINLSRTSLAVVPALMLALAVATAGLASDRVEHYEAKSAATLEEAVANFAEYNDKLAAILEQEELEGADLEAIHELTYTLENALERMREDMVGLADTLEALHLASEDHNEAVAREQGAAYLTTARTLVR